MAPQGSGPKRRRRRADATDSEAGQRDPEAEKIAEDLPKEEFPKRALSEGGSDGPHSPEPLQTGVDRILEYMFKLAETRSAMGLELETDPWHVARQLAHGRMRALNSETELWASVEKRKAKDGGLRPSLCLCLFYTSEAADELTRRALDVSRFAIEKTRYTYNLYINITFNYTLSNTNVTHTHYL